MSKNTILTEQNLKFKFDFLTLQWGWLWKSSVYSLELTFFAISSFSFKIYIINDRQDLNADLWKRVILADFQLQIQYFEFNIRKFIVLMPKVDRIGIFIHRQKWVR